MVARISIAGSEGGNLHMARRKRSDVPGTIYLLHFAKPYHHAKHYLGWASDVDERLAQHRKGAGARLVAVITEAGIPFELAATWPGTRNDERKMKRRAHISRRCPLCRQGGDK